KRLPAAGLSDRTHRSRKMVFRKRHRTRQSTNEGLGGEPCADGKVVAICYGTQRHKGTKTQRKGAFRINLWGLSLCLCAFVSLCPMNLTRMETTTVLAPY